jgi:hypothetical protein
MKRIPLTWSTSVLVMVFATAAVAQENVNLKGDYGLTGTVVCNLASGAVLIATTNGIVTFHGDGTGTASLMDQTSIAGAIGSAAADKLVDTFTYTVNEDGSWTRTIDPGSFKGTVVSGPAAGLTFSVDQVSATTGFVGVNAMTLTAVTNEAIVETITRSDGTVGHRICQRSQTLIKRPS